LVVYLQGGTQRVLLGKTERASPDLLLSIEIQDLSFEIQSRTPTSEFPLEEKDFKKLTLTIEGLEDFVFAANSTDEPGALIWKYPLPPSLESQAGSRSWDLEALTSAGDRISLSGDFRLVVDALEASLSHGAGESLAVGVPFECTREWMPSLRVSANRAATVRALLDGQELELQRNRVEPGTSIALPDLHESFRDADADVHRLTIQLKDDVIRSSSVIVDHSFEYEFIVVEPARLTLDLGRPGEHLTPDPNTGEVITSLSELGLHLQCRAKAPVKLLVQLFQDGIECAESELQSGPELERGKWISLPALLESGAETLPDGEYRVELSSLQTQTRRLPFRIDTRPPRAQLDGLPESCAMSSSSPSRSPHPSARTPQPESTGVSKALERGREVSKTQPLPARSSLRRTPPTATTP